VAELGYVFRDLPWKTLDLFTEKTADAGLLDVFSTNDFPAVVGRRVNLNILQTSVLQSILAGAIWDELDSTNSVSKTGVTATAAPVLASNITTATSSAPLANRSQLVTRSNLPLTVLPLPSGGRTINQSKLAARPFRVQSLRFHRHEPGT